MEDAICPTYNSILDEYMKKAYPLMDELETHIRGCEECQKYILENRDAMALSILGVADEDLEKRMKEG